MTQATAPIPAPAPLAAPPPARAWPFFTWLALQLAALLLAAFRIPLSARFPVPEEQMALYEMYCVQMIASALLFPILFRSLAGAVLTIVVAPWMVQLAGILAIAEVSLAQCLYPMVWLLTLALWSFVLRGERAKQYGVAAATLLVLGGALAAYFAREFGTPGQPFDAAKGYWGPLGGGLSLLAAWPGAGKAWASLGIVLFISILAAIWRFRSDRSGLPSELPLPPILK